MKVKDFFVGAGSVAALGWISGTAMGAIAGSLLPESIRMALDVMLYGMFIAIVVPQAKEEKPILIAVIHVMAVTTYLIRALPLALLKKPIENRFLKSFLHYVPTACLTAMTFPAILSAMDHTISGILGLVTAVLLSLKEQSLIVVAVATCGAVFYQNNS